MSWLIPKPGDYPPREVARRLKQVPIHALVSHVLQHHKEGDPCHQLALSFLSKWQETHTAAEQTHEMEQTLRQDRDYYLNLIRSLQDKILVLKAQHDILYALSQVTMKPRLQLC